MDLDIFLVLQHVPDLPDPFLLLLAVTGVVENPSFPDAKRHEEVVFIGFVGLSAAVELVSRGTDSES